MHQIISIMKKSNRLRNETKQKEKIYISFTKVIPKTEIEILKLRACNKSTRDSTV